MANIETLKKYFTEETYATMEQEIGKYSENNPDEKIRFENVSSGDYVSAKKLSKAEGEAERLRGEIEKLKGTISDKDTDADEQLKKLQEQIDTMNAQNAAREAETRLNARFDAAKGANEFVNKFTENGVRDAFKAALEAKENAGKSDADIYAAVVSSLGDVYRNPHKPNDIPPMGDVDEKLDAEKFKGMTLDEQMKFANSHSEQYKRIFKE